MWEKLCYLKKYLHIREKEKYGQIAENFCIYMYVVGGETSYLPFSFSTPAVEYSPDLLVSDCHLFQFIQQSFSGWHFQQVQDIENFPDDSESLFYDRIYSLAEKWHTIMKSLSEIL